MPPMIGPGEHFAGGSKRLRDNVASSDVRERLQAERRVQEDREMLGRQERERLEESVKRKQEEEDERLDHPPLMMCLDERRIQR